MTTGSDSLTRIIAIIFTIGLIAVSFVFGLFFFLVILGASLVLTLVIWVRQKMALGKSRTGEGSRVIEAAFQVIDKQASDEDQK